MIKVKHSRFLLKYLRYECINCQCGCFYFILHFVALKVQADMLTKQHIKCPFLRTAIVCSLPQKLQSRKSSSSMEEKGAGCSIDRPEEEGVASGSARCTAACKIAAASSLSDGSERDSGAQDSSNDADSEASESEWTPRTFPSSHGYGHMSTPSSSSTLTPSPTPMSGPSPSTSSRQGGAVEQLVTAVSKVNINLAAGDCPLSSHCSAEEQEEMLSRDNLHHQHHQGAFQALSHSYTPSSKECSIQSCLHQFTSVELLMGNNKLLCENCTERKQKQLRKSGAAGKFKSFF